MKSKLIAVAVIVAAIFFGGWYAKHEAVASFGHAIATHQQRMAV